MSGKELRNNSIIMSLMFFTGNILLILRIGNFKAAAPNLLGYRIANFDHFNWYFKGCNDVI